MKLILTGLVIIAALVFAIYLVAWLLRLISEIWNDILIKLKLRDKRKTQDDSSHFQPSRPKVTSFLNLPKKPTLDELISKHGLSLQKFLSDFKPSSRSYDIENSTMEFLRLVWADDSQNPGYVYYNQWCRNAVYPWKDYGEFVHQQLSKRSEVLREKKQVERDLAREKEVARILDHHKVRVSKFLEIVFRKKTTLDDYGEEDSTAFDKEFDRFITKLAESEHTIQAENRGKKSRSHSEYMDTMLRPVSSLLKAKLHSMFTTYYQERSQDLSSRPVEVEKMSGIEFEVYLIEEFKKCGVTDIHGTKAVGDQGADILFSYSGRRIVVQAKRYTGSVGNAAVQQVNAAKGFYKVDDAWVVTNSKFTSSAEELARQLNVYLLDGQELRDFKYKFNEYFKKYSRQTT